MGKTGDTQTGAADIEAKNLVEALEKNRQLCTVLEKCFDLLNGDITDAAWLTELADLATCHTVQCIWWRAHLPETYSMSACGNPENDAREWVDYLEPALAAAKPGEVRLIEGLTDDNRMLSPDRMVYCLDHSPVRVVFIFSQHKHKKHWDDADKQHLLRVMRIIDKPVRTQRTLSFYADIQDLSNKFMDEMPRALMVLTPDGDIISTNRLAKQLIEKGDLMRVRSNKLNLNDPVKHHE
ncbi:MAG: hypothetical protein KJP03_08435, partial [Gammaproteobacteria bacterium]|nr:hypothetical protein [Gammaproteobacteria bacterium]